MSSSSKWSSVLGVCAALVVAAGAATALHAVSVGDVDPTFGSGGTTIVSYGQNGTRIAESLQLPDGRQIVAGTTITATFYDPIRNVTSFAYEAVVMRFTKDGALDTTFNATGATPGVLQFDLGADELVTSAALDLSVTGHPRVVVAGYARLGPYSALNMMAARVDDTGQLDATFGTGGIAALPFVDDPNDVAQLFQASAAAFAVAVQPDGKVVLGGQAKDSKVYGSGYAYVVTRLTGTGATDPTFSTVKVFAADGGLNDLSYVTGLTVDADGTIVTAFTASPGISAQSYLIRVPAAGGTGDPAVRIYHDNMVSLRTLAPAPGQTRGQLVVGGTDMVLLYPQPSYDWFLARYNPDFTADAAFGSSGVLRVDSGGYQDWLHHLEVLSDGRLLASGTVGRFGPEAVGVVRVSTSGQVDTTLGPGGLLRVDVAQNDLWGAAFMQNEKILVVDNIGDTTNWGAVALTRVVGAVPTISLQNGGQVTEGNTGSTTTKVVTVSLSKPFGETVTVGYETWADPSLAGWAQVATVGVDYQATSGTLTFLPGETTKTFDVTVIGDGIYEGDELVSVRLLNASANANLPTGSASGTFGIAEDEPMPRISFPNVTVVEGNSGTKNLSLTFTQSAVCTLETLLSYATLDTTGAANLATPGVDYVGNYDYVSIPAGQTSVTVSIPILGDTLVEGDEVFDVSATPTRRPP
jgi:uncharacterized delta-60 repeat protein